MNKNSPKVTLLIVVRNERDYIEKSLNSLLNQTYPKKLTEIIVIDGMSTDGTIEYLKKRIKKLKKEGIDIKLFTNPKKILSSGWNIGIKEARGDIVCRIDAHNEIDKNYIKIGVEELLKINKNKVVCIGGVEKNIGVSFTGKAIANLFSSKFGVGNSAFRIGVKVPSFTDTAMCGLYWKRIFNKVGYFDESLERNQDIALHTKIRKKGYKFITHPDMRTKYYVRSTIPKLIKKAFSDGYWTIFSKGLYLRHKIPLFFVLYLFFIPLFIYLLKLSTVRYFCLLPLGFYFILAIYFSIKDGKSWSKLVLLPLFPIFHIFYGLGSIWGLLTLWKVKK